MLSMAGHGIHLVAGVAISHVLVAMQQIGSWGEVVELRAMAEVSAREFADHPGSITRLLASSAASSCGKPVRMCSTLTEVSTRIKPPSCGAGWGSSLSPDSWGLAWRGGRSPATGWCAGQNRRACQQGRRPECWCHLGASRGICRFSSGSTLYSPAGTIFVEWSESSAVIRSAPEP